MIFAYIGPETMMPVASGIAALVGVFLMFGRSVLLFFGNMGRKIGLVSDRKQTVTVRKDDLSASVAPVAAAEEKPAAGGEL